MVEVMFVRACVFHFLISVECLDFSYLERERERETFCLSYADCSVLSSVLTFDLTDGHVWNMSVDLAK